MIRTMASERDLPNILYHLGRVYHYSGKYERAKACLRCAELLQRRRSPKSDFSYARTLTDLEVIYSELGDLMRAIRLQERAISIHKNSLSENSLHIAFHSSQLAFYYFKTGQYYRSRVLLVSSLEFLKNNMSDHHPSEAVALHTMALAKRALGNQTIALALFRQALQMREQLLALDHPSVACICYDMSVLLAEEDDKHTIALDYAKIALKIRQSKLQPHHKHLLESITLVDRLSSQECVASHQWQEL